MLNPNHVEMNKDDHRGTVVPHPSDSSQGDNVGDTINSAKACIDAAESSRSTY